MMIELYDTSAEVLSPYFRLTDPQLRSRLEAERGLFIAESLPVIESALEAGCEPISFLGEKKKLISAGICERYPELPVYTMESELLEALTGYAMTRGILCAMKRPVPKETQELCKQHRRLAMLEGIVDASNLGAIFRSAAALGIEGILLCTDCCDPYSRKALRVSMGAVFRIPFARMDSRRCIDLLHENGFAVLGFALGENSVALGSPLLQAYPKQALLLGNEGHGIRPETLALCDQKVLIPMHHGMDSLNVAAAAAIGFWELCQNRTEDKL